jgi:hypothetical protein
MWKSTPTDFLNSSDRFFELVEIDSLVRTEGVNVGTSITASKMFLRECLNNCL